MENAPKDVMGLKEAAEYLNVKPRTVREWLHGGRLPGRKIGREWRLSRKALDEYLAATEKA